MVLAAYLAGLVTLPATIGGAYLGAWWWVRLRRAQTASEPLELTEVPPAPSLPQDPDSAPQLNRLRFRTVPGRRRVVRGHRPR